MNISERLFSVQLYKYFHVPINMTFMVLKAFWKINTIRFFRQWLAQLENRTHSPSTARNKERTQLGTQSRKGLGRGGKTGNHKNTTKPCTSILEAKTQQKLNYMQMERNHPKGTWRDLAVKFHPKSANISPGRFVLPGAQGPFSCLFLSSEIFKVGPS